MIKVSDTTQSANLREYCGWTGNTEDDIVTTVTIHFTDPSRAVTITPDDPLYQGETVTMLLMPMLVND